MDIGIEVLRRNGRLYRGAMKKTADETFTATSYSFHQISATAAPLHRRSSSTGIVRSADECASVTSLRLSSPAVSAEKR